MFVTARYNLTESFKAKLLSMQPNFGFGIFGQIVYYRSYSRIKEDGSQEGWADTVIRVIEGVMSIRLDWYNKNNIFWNSNKWDRFAEQMAISMFNMNWLPPGRGLWAMGTEMIYERGSMPLYNCGCTKIGGIDWVSDISILMDMLMNGVGIGFKPIQTDLKLTKPHANWPITHQVGDSREGWTKSVEILLNSYIGTNNATVVFDYSIVRPFGSPIKGFGGVASGPEPLRILHEQIRGFCNDYISGKSSFTRFVTDIANCVGVCIVAGNVRRSAEIAIGSIDDTEFLDLKNYDKYPERAAYGWMSNNSVTLNSDEDFDKLSEISSRVVSMSEPGLLNLRNFKHGRLGRNDNSPEDFADGINPCITGDTKVCVADGRGFVPIKDLLDEDPLVYCINEYDEVVVKKLQHPRLTGHNQKILKITFDTGDTIRVTENHKIMLLDRSFSRADELDVGDRVTIFNRYIPSQAKESYHDQYISIGYSGVCLPEHRLIGKYKFGDIDGKHVHHTNQDKLDNTPSNLEVKESFDHLSEHSIGLENGNSSGYTHGNLIEIGVALCKKLGRRFSKTEWQEAGPIKSFSAWRKASLGSLTEFSYMCADLAQVYDNAPKVKNHEDKSIVRLKFITRLENAGYDCLEEEGVLYVVKVCEGCNLNFKVPVGNREQACCSLSCNNTIRDYSKNSEGLRKTYDARRVSKRNLQLEVYKSLERVLGRTPLRDEWKDECYVQNVSYAISRKSSPFRNWQELKNAAKDYNHSIISIEEDGYEDVYNGTVEQHHNYIIGGWEDSTLHGRLVQRGIITPQCGEIPLESIGETCNVVDTLPTRCKDVPTWLRACEFATFYASTVALLPTHQHRTNSVVSRNRRIGVGIIDFAGWKEQSGMNKVIKYMRAGYARVKYTNQLLAKEAGVRDSIRVTTIKPGGSTTKIAGRQSGIGHPNFDYMIRRIRVQKGHPIEQLLKDANIPFEPCANQPDFTTVFEVPIYMGEVRTMKDVSLWEQAMNLVTVQREWADNAVSNTLVFKEEEKGIVEFVLSAIAPMTKSISLMPYCTDSYAQMPEEGITPAEYHRRINEIKAIDWSTFRNSDGTDEKFCEGDKCSV